MLQIRTGPNNGPGMKMTGDTIRHLYELSVTNNFSVSLAMLSSDKNETLHSILRAAANGGNSTALEMINVYDIVTMARCIENFPKKARLFEVYQSRYSNNYMRYVIYVLFLSTL